MAKHSKAKVAAGVGTGVAALAAAGAAAYFFYGSKKAAANRKKAGQWAHKAKAEVIRDLKKAKKIDQAAYHKVVNGVMNRYSKMGSANKKEIAVLTKQAKGQWKNIQKHIAKAQKKGKR